MTPARASHAATPALERVEPQLRDLLGRAQAARALPDWSARIRARGGGAYLSSLRGRGMEYDESRPYQPGDDVRQLDWRVTARTGRPHTKLFREERERPVFLAVDYRRAMFFATRGVFKAVQAARLAALLAWRAQHNGDRVGGVLFAGHEHHELAPRRGQAATVAWLKLLAHSAPACRRAAATAGSDAALVGAIQRLRRLAKPGSLVFVISDWRGFAADAAAELALLARHCGVAVASVHDPLEAAFPADLDDVNVTDGSHSLSLRGIDAGRRAAYAERHAERVAALGRVCREQRLPWVEVATDADPLAALVQLLGDR